MAIYSSYLSGHSAQTALASGISTNTTELGYISNYTTLRAGLDSAIQSAAATLATTPNTTNGDALVTAVQNKVELFDAYARVASVLDTAINGVGGTIFVRLLPLVQNALVEAIALIDQACASIGFGTGITVANEQLRNALTVQTNIARDFLALSKGARVPSDLSGAIAWLQA